MPSYNRVILIGNLTRDPETKFVGQIPKCSFGLAMNRKWKGQDGQQREETCFVDCEAWRRTAEVVQQYCHKGNPVLVEGHLSLDQWQAQDGSARSKLYVSVDNVQLLGQPPQNRQQGQQGGGQQQQREAPAGNPQDEMYGEDPF